MTRHEIVAGSEMIADVQHWFSHPVVCSKGLRLRHDEIRVKTLYDSDEPLVAGEWSVKGLTEGFLLQCEEDGVQKLKIFAVVVHKIVELEPLCAFRVAVSSVMDTSEQAKTYLRPSAFTANRVENSVLPNYGRNFFSDQGEK